MTHLTEEDLILIYYNEPGIPAGAREHLADCRACRAASDALAETLNFCGELTTPEPAPDFGRTAWARLAPHLQQEPSRRWFHRLIQRKLWIAVPAMAALVVAAFIAGRGSVTPPKPVTAGLSRQARQRILAISVADHLDRAERLLTEVANTSETDAPHLGTLRERAQDLVQEGRLMRQWSSDENTAATPVLDDIERFVLELANAPDRIDSEELRGLKQHIDSESLLFKVRIIQSNLPTSGQKL